uniref:Uncharacterized protein n=1 Tax=Fagus sylvatica TaxID=28930 RepID=A0A2N9GG00_FAGSY
MQLNICHFAVLVSSSCSTDETVVADSDLEVETATSNHANVTVCTEEAIVSKAETSMASDLEVEAATSIHEAATSIHADVTVCTDEAIKVVSKAETSMASEEAIKFASKAETVMDHAAIKSKDSCGMSYRDGSCGMTIRIDKVDESECGNLDILFSQDLVVRDMKIPSRTNTQSGNSFNNLIPFSKHPYKGSDDGNEDTVELVKAEKKRKQMEAVAEDLFNNEKARKRGVAGSLRGLLTHG